MAKRSTQMVIIGAAVFMIGAGLVFIGLRSDGGAAAATPTPTPTATAPGGVVAQSGTTTPLPDVALPKGMTAVAVRFDEVAGLAGFVKPGDQINIYATSKGGEPTRVTCDFRATSARAGSVSCGPGAKLAAPYAKLILPKVQVLDVIGAGAPGAQTFLVALNESDAERLIFFMKFESVWATLVADDHRSAPTPGRDYGNALKGVAE